MAFFTQKKKTTTKAAETATLTPTVESTETVENKTPNTLEEIMLQRCESDSDFLHWFYPDEGTYILTRKDKKEFIEIKDVKAFSLWHSIEGVLYAKLRRKSTSKAGLVKYEAGKLVEVLPSVFDNINISVEGILTAEVGGRIYEYPLKKEVHKGPVKVNSINDIIAAVPVATP